MPLTGELEHLPIVDVIQLIYATKKSGTLNVYSRKGEGQLVFNEGFIVSATHSNEQLRIGQILIESEIISIKDLDKALAFQDSAGEDRKPLLATLFDQCGLSKEQAFKALEKLIELTIVEMISWTKGIFSFDVDKILITDEYRYLPTQMQELNLDTQMVLMDALRIFDEKVHAGEIKVVDEPLDEIPDEVATLDAETEPAEEIVVSEDILGLADLDKIEKRKPHVFKSLEVFDPAVIHRQEINTTLPDLSEDEQEELASYLAELAKQEYNDNGILGKTTDQALIMFSDDSFAQHGIRTICQKENILFFSTSDLQEFNSQINRALGKKLEPIIVFDQPDVDVSGIVSELETELKELFQLVSIAPGKAPEPSAFSDDSIAQGQDCFFNKTVFSEAGKETFVAETIDFFTAFQNFLRSYCSAPRRTLYLELVDKLKEFESLTRPPEISLAVLKYIGQMFDRTQTLIIDKNELIAERSIGVTADREQGVAAAQKFRVTIKDESIFRKIVAEKTVMFDATRDSSLADLFHEIGAPFSSQILLAPMYCRNRPITLTYADFGNEVSRQVPVDLIQFCTTKAGQAMEKVLFKQSSTPQN